jgi:hypothetical protein
MITALGNHPFLSHGCRVVIALFLLAALPLTAQDDPFPEVRVNVLPTKGMKFDPMAIYREDQEVLQGAFGTSADDEIADLATLPDGRILAIGTLGAPAEAAKRFPVAPADGVGATGSAVVAVFDPTFRTLEKLVPLPKDISRAACVRVGADGSVFLGGDVSGGQQLAVMKFSPSLDVLLWRADATGDRMTGMALMPDGSVVVAPDQSPFVSRIRADGSGLVPFGTDQHFRVDGANPQVAEKFWQDNGYAEMGYRGCTYQRGGSGGIGVTPEGNLVFFTTNFVKLPDGNPDFDPMLLKFTPSGEVLWARNLLQGLPSPSDQKSPHLHVDPYSGDLLLALRQHGSFAKNMAVGPKAYLTTEAWLTGNIMIGWIGRIDPATGEVKAGTMYFPDMGRPPKGGKRTANSLFPSAVRADAAGRIYVTGAAAHKLNTTRHAFQPEPLGGSGFLTVFDPDLSRVLYANLLTGQGFNLPGVALAVTVGGPVVAAALESTGKPPYGFVEANAEKTNFLSPEPLGGKDAMLSLFPFQTWFVGE